MNPLLQPFKTPFGTPPFDQIKTEHFLPAIKDLIAQAREEIEQKIKKSTEEATFENTIAIWEAIEDRLNNVVEIFFSLYSAHCNDEMAQIAQEIGPMMSEFSNDIYADDLIFKRVKAVKATQDSKTRSPLGSVEMRLLEKSYKAFARNGALLDEPGKKRLKEIDAALSRLGLDFGNNVLKETNNFFLHLSDKNDVKGLPAHVLETAEAEAKKRNLEGWVITLHAPSFIPFMKYADNASLRERLYTAYMYRGYHGNEYDNTSKIKTLLKLRNERARLLGYATHADYVLEERMAEKKDTVLAFLKDILAAAKPVAQKELQELREYKQKKTGDATLNRWDYSYWSEKLKKEKFDIDDEALRPYFKLENCIDGLFKVANKLFGITLTPDKSISVYHPEVTAFEVKEEKSGRHIGVLYTDFFPRETKRAGAWMSGFREGKILDGKPLRPHASIVCNFTKPGESRPSLLSFDEVLTVFHEFGHALHGLLTEGRFASIGGTNVYWDFVELPSQIMENWVYEKECLDLFARHYQTGEAVPAEIIKKIRASSTFHEGMATLRQLSFATLDIAYHTTAPTEIVDVVTFEREALRDTDIFGTPAVGCSSCGFSHIFQGGYSSGYYSYKWAEVLDADAFELFKEKGIFNPDVARSFKENILSKGNSAHPMALYEKFRGRKPSVKALLKRAGFVA